MPFPTRPTRPAGQAADIGSTINGALNAVAQPVAAQLAATIQADPSIQRNIGYGVGQGAVNDAKPYIVAVTVLVGIGAAALVYMAAKRAR